MAGVVAVAACGSAGTSGDDGAVTLEVWSVIDPESTTDPRGAAFQDQLEVFEESHPDFKVNVTVYPFAKIAEELIRASATGRGPDVVDVYDPVVPMHIAAESIQPLDDYAGPWLDEFGDDYIFPLEPLRGGGDSIYAMAYEMRGQVLWYRQDLLDQAGVAAPTSLSEVAASAGALSELPGDVTGFGFGLSTDLAGSDLVEKFIPLLWGFGGEYIGEDGRAEFNSHAGVQAIEWLLSVRDNGGYGEGALRTNSDDVLAQVRAGTAAMTVGGTQRVASARTGDGVGENLVTAPIPGAEPGTVVPTLVEGWTYAIGANSEHPDEAWEFIKAKLTSEYQVRSADAGVLPVLASTYENGSPELLSWRDYLAEHGRSVHYPEDWSELNTDLTAAVQDIIFHDAPVQETLDELAEAYNSEHGFD
ncbi:ABC transporter substrate-binding protein [Jiangella asiatica]|uniref:ABC transporter substrate-binding protein n=1 Tax=Jiangella asiatica TaxID=2530372 RepID=UPI0013A5E2FB|nr:extracellular solute-binding protein [Jiangella asiatica]